jgi:hypothetical protein
VFLYAFLAFTPVRNRSTSVDTEVKHKYLCASPKSPTQATFMLSKCISIIAFLPLLLYEFSTGLLFLLKTVKHCGHAQIIFFANHALNKIPITNKIEQVKTSKNSGSLVVPAAILLKRSLSRRFCDGNNEGKQSSRQTKN